MIHYKENFIIALLATGIVNLLVGFFVYFKNKKNKVNITFALFSFAVSLWSLTQVGNVYGPTVEDSYYWARLEQIPIPFIPVFFVHFVISLLKLKNRAIFLRFCYIFGFAIAVLAPTTKLVCPSASYKFGLIFFGNPGLLYPYLILFFISCMLYGFFELVRAYNRSKGILRNQLRYLVWSSSLGFAGGCSSFFIVYDFNLFPLNPFGTYLVAIYVLIVTYAILKHRLLDVSVAITRTGIFVAVYSLILGTPLLLIYFLQNELVGFFGLSWWVVPFLCSTGLATLGPFLYIYFNNKAEERLLKEQRNYQKILRSASSGMIRIRNLDLLLKLIVYVVAKIVRIKHALIYLLNSEYSFYVLKAFRSVTNMNNKTATINFESPVVYQLTKNREPLVTEEVMMRLKDDPSNVFLDKLVRELNVLNAALVIPSFVEDRLIGILILGEKRSGKMYSQDDLAVFSVLANQAALAIENAQFYEEIRRTQESLFQAEKMATIGTMADGLSHQINNRFHALSLIAGDSLDVIKTYDCSQCGEETKQIFNDLKNSLERIQANVLQGGEVVKGLLKYSRPEQGGFERVNFKDVLDGAVEMVSYKIKLREIDLVKDIPSSLPCLNANIVQLQEVFFNLIDNAYDAIKERQMILNEGDYRGRIEISVMADQGALHINVQDNGIGIKSDDKRKVFTPFFTTKATSRKGTGLGLYVIQKIIAAHNGQIRINSVYQSGTCFTVTLPIKPTLAAV